MALAGKKVLAFESRRARELEELLRKRGAIPTVAPSVREVTQTENPAAEEFARRLAAREFDLVICLTGVALRHLFSVLEDPGGTRQGLSTTPTLVRGPKPAAVMRELGLEPTFIAREPATWREVLELLKPRTERRLAVLEYGRPDERLLAGLASQGREVSAFPVYQYDLPQDLAPLESAIRAAVRDEFDTLIFTSSIQFDHVRTVAARLGVEPRFLEAMSRTRIASIGPTMSETLGNAGFTVFQPSSSKMGVLIHELDQLP